MRFWVQSSRTTFCLITSLLFLLLSWNLAAVGFDTEVHHRVLNITEAQSPQIIGNTLLFSYDAPQGTQVVSMALEKEGYRLFHTYKVNNNGVFILTMPLENIEEGNLRYRLVVDGLWTIDPSVSIKRDTRGIRVSHLQLPFGTTSPKPGVHPRSDGSLLFVYTGKPGARVSVVGDFNRWDPFVSPMKESLINPGTYTLSMNLPEEARHYRYVVDGAQIPDPGNPSMTRNGWGEVASMIPGKL
ncbi:MAG: hypothetical protein MI717_02200 [Spirochaetales bacterium]|nr:hypothetical protein [Spirochaetales bacterium]